MNDYIYGGEPNRELPSERIVPEISRRRFLELTGAVVGVAVLSLIVHDIFDGSEPDVFDEMPAALEGDRILNPKISIRTVDIVDDDRAEQSEIEYTQEQLFRINAPVFTLTIDVQPGDTLSDLARRFYPKKYVYEGVNRFTAIDAMLEANPDLAEDPDSLMIGQQLYIPVSDPAIVKMPNPETAIKDASEKYGYSIESLVALNSGPTKLDGAVILPAQAEPRLSEDEEIYIVKSTDRSYYGIARQNDFNLGHLIGSNRPDVDKLEAGHILRSSTVGASALKSLDIESASNSSHTIPEVITTTTTAAPAGEQIYPEILPSTDVAQLMDQRTWKEFDHIQGNVGDEEARKVSDFDVELETEIAASRLETVELTKAGYEEFKSTINREFLGVFAEGDNPTVHPTVDIISKEDIKYFVLHHTGAGYREGLEGVTQFAHSLRNGGPGRPGLSVQWLIDRRGVPYMLMEERQAAQQSYGVNEVSTGVEIMTDHTKAQGSLTENQLQAAMYLAVYEMLEVYGKEAGDVRDVVSGHRHVNDAVGVGTGGKLDFNEEDMKNIWPKIEALVEQFTPAEIHAMRANA